MAGPTEPRPARRVRLEITGVVQGVGFRWFVREKARRWGVDGWVRNAPSGVVELVARGTAESVSGLVREVWHGPDGARVDAVRELPSDDSEEFPSPFEIRRHHA